MVIKPSDNFQNTSLATDGFLWHWNIPTLKKVCFISFQYFYSSSVLKVNNKRRSRLDVCMRRCTQVVSFKARFTWRWCRHCLVRAGIFCVHPKFHIAELVWNLPKFHIAELVWNLKHVRKILTLIGSLHSRYFHELLSYFTLVAVNYVIDMSFPSK